MQLDSNSVERMVASAIWSLEDPHFMDIVYPSSFIFYSVVCGFQSVALFLL